MKRDVMKLIKDLGTRPIGKNKHMTRYGLFACPICDKQKEIQLRKETLDCPMCRSCSTSKQLTKHGECKRDLKTRHPLYGVWSDMKQRCYNPKHKMYVSYGKKGVTICKEWIDNPEVFIAWGKENGYEVGLQIDKDKKCIDGDIYPRLYSPETCQFVSFSENLKLRHYKKEEL